VPIQPDEVQKRFSVFYGVGCVASALAGILAFGLIHMDGIQGISGWRWIFIMEGVVCHKLLFRIKLSGILTLPDNGRPGRSLLYSHC
jgi:MFS family permease